MDLKVGGRRLAALLTSSVPMTRTAKIVLAVAMTVGSLGIGVVLSTASHVVGNAGDGDLAKAMRRLAGMSPEKGPVASTFHGDDAIDRLAAQKLGPLDQGPPEKDEAAARATIIATHTTRDEAYRVHAIHLTQGKRAALKAIHAKSTEKKP